MDPAHHGSLDTRLAQLAFLLVIALLAFSGRELREEVDGWWRARVDEVARGQPGAGPDGAPETGRPRDLLEEMRAFFRYGEEDGASGGGAAGSGEATPNRLRLNPSEVAFVVENHVVPRIPAGVTAPAVSLRDSTLVVSATVDPGRLLGSGVPALLRRTLGDSTRLTAELMPSVPRPGRLRLHVLQVRAGALEVPTMLLPWVLEGSGIEPVGSDPRVVEFPVLPDLTAVRVERGELVLERGNTGRP